MENEKARIEEVVKKMEHKKRPCEPVEAAGRDETTVFAEDDPLCATLDNLCAALDIWKETLNNPWQRADREYMKKLAGDVRELLRMMLMDAEALAAKYTESCPKSVDRDKK